MTFHGHWHICQVRRQPSCRGSVAWLGSNPSLATREDATVEVVLATCRKCSSKLCLLFGPFGPTSLQQKQLRKNHSCGTATSYAQVLEGNHTHTHVTNLRVSTLKQLYLYRRRFWLQKMHKSLEKKNKTWQVNPFVDQMRFELTIHESHLVLSLSKRIVQEACYEGSNVDFRATWSTWHLHSVASSYQDSYS